MNEELLKEYPNEEIDLYDYFQKYSNSEDSDYSIISGVLSKGFLSVLSAE